MKLLRPFSLVYIAFGYALFISGIDLAFAPPVYAEAGHDDHSHGESHAEDHNDEGDHRDDDHDEHEEGVVYLNATKLAAVRLSLVEVQRGSLSQVLELAAEVRWNAERIAHVVPRVPGVVRQVYKSLGDTVKAGEMLALLDSRELATAKAAYLTALARERLSRANYEREEKLWKQKLSPERDYLASRSALAEASIEKRLTQLQLLAIGLSEAEIEAIPDVPDVELARYRMVAPFAGLVVDRHATMGEMLGDESESFEILDPSDVWVMGRAYEHDLRLLQTGQKAVVRLNAMPGEQYEGKVDYIASQLDHETRTVEVRVVLANPQLRFRSGMFGSVSVFGSAVSGEGVSPVGMLVPHGAVQPADGGFAVFHQSEPGEFRMIHVQVRGRSKEFAWVEGDLRVGDLVAVGDTFVLKSEAAKEEMGGGHSH